MGGMKTNQTIQTMFSNRIVNGGISEGQKAHNLFGSRMGRGFTGNTRGPRIGCIIPEEEIGQLTVREREVLQLIAEGKANKVTASELSISCKTVEKHRASLTEKLGIHGTAGLTHYAIAAGIVECNPWLCRDQKDY